jgi:hypothetical protein
MKLEGNLEREVGFSLIHYRVVLSTHGGQCGSVWQFIGPLKHICRYLGDGSVSISYLQPQ